MGATPVLFTILWVPHPGLFYFTTMASPNFDHFETPNEAPASGPSRATDESSPSPMVARQLFATANTNTGATTSYLLQPISEQESLNYSHVQEEEEEMGDTDSVIDSAEAVTLEMSASDVFRSHLEVLMKNEDVVEDPRLDPSILQSGVTPDINMPKVPDDWKPPEVKADRSEPPFDQVDNPGGWSDYSF